ITTATPSNDFRTSESLHAKHPANSKINTITQRTGPLTLNPFFLESKPTTATNAPAHISAFKPHGVSRSSRSPSTPNATADTNSVNPVFVRSLISVAPRDRAGSLARHFNARRLSPTLRTAAPGDARLPHPEAWPLRQQLL